MHVCGTAWVQNWKIIIFHIHFLNIDISLAMALTYLKTSTHIANTHLEGSVSQNVDIYFSFYFLLSRSMDYEKKYKKVTKVTEVGCDRGSILCDSRKKCAHP